MRRKPATCTVVMRFQVFLARPDLVKDKQSGFGGGFVELVIKAALLRSGGRNQLLEGVAHDSLITAAGANVGNDDDSFFHV